MKIYVFNLKRFFLFLAVLTVVVLLISFASIKGMEALGVSTTTREIPIYSVETANKTAAITFDCAWGADDIPDILKALKEADVRATFFIVGQWAEKYPDKVRMIAQDGHDIANHSYAHLQMGGMGKSACARDLAACGEVLEKLSGKKCELFRAPYGDYGNELLRAAREQGYYTIQWNVDSLDWKPDISKTEILRRIDSKIAPGSILLFHNDTAHTAALLPDILARLKTDGYSLVPVSELIMRDGYLIDGEGRQKKAS